VETGRAKVGDVELAYDVFGTTGRPLVLIMGIGAQRIQWDASLCERFAGAGFRVVRFDHRDIGQSSRLDAAVPRPAGVIARRLVGAHIDAPYTLSDLASDVVGLMDRLGFAKAHVVGASLGGMVGQHLAIEHPDRVATLTSIMSSPGARRYLPKPFAMRALFQPMPKTAEEAGNRVADIFATIGSPAYPANLERLRALGRASHANGMSPRGFLRQFAAVMASGDRSRKLRDVHVPTLVIHGSRDPMFPVRAGRDLARLMPDATWLPLAGMGHDLPEALWPTIVAAVARHASRHDAVA